MCFHRLGKALIRRNQIENENAAIKGKIDKLRRKVHNDMNNRESMEKELIDVKEDVDEIMMRAAAVANERDRMLSEGIKSYARTARSRRSFKRSTMSCVSSLLNRQKPSRTQLPRQPIAYKRT